jgi:hypothetical protein
MFGKKKIEPICKNCKLFDAKKGMCKVTVLYGGEKFNMPVFPEDKCHMDALGVEVQEVRWWVEDESGNKTAGDGKVKIEYPVGFFGKEDNK